jgi:hypothetical protein
MPSPGSSETWRATPCMSRFMRLLRGGVVILVVVGIDLELVLDGAFFSTGFTRLSSG